MNPSGLISVITPAFNEAASLPLLQNRLVAVLSGLEWEWVVIDDHSSDETFHVISKLASADGRVRGFRLARNSGSHAAINCGLERARGAAALVLSADLQGSPETIPALIAHWRDGAQVVWASRQQAPSAASKL